VSKAKAAEIMAEVRTRTRSEVGSMVELARISPLLRALMMAWSLWIRTMISVRAWALRTTTASS
tara:strand:- start:915 stop:1106 length:192 start_codon:yes stop_codon:yes gene_type:complete